MNFLRWIRWDSIGKTCVSSGYLHSHGIDGPNRNRWFTELKNGGSFHGELLVITRWYPQNVLPRLFEGLLSAVSMVSNHQVRIRLHSSWRRTVPRSLEAAT